MRLLLDESVPRRLKRSLPRHAVRNVVEMGWDGIRNGELLARAANEFDALVTVDKNLQYQQNLDNLPIAVIVLDAKPREPNRRVRVSPRRARRRTRRCAQ
jgi:predicted nuclease of predicted toxin-antitoxin system